MNQNHLSR